MSSGFNSPRRSVGFTLAEILVVVVILGIAAAIIVPLASNRDDLRALSMARVMMADLAFAQSRAVSMQKRHYIRFDMANNKYEVLDQITPAEQLITHPVNQTPFVVLLGSARKDAVKDVVLDSATFNTHPVLMFDELGTPHAYDPVNETSAAMAAGSVQLKSNNYTLTITIEPYSGELKVN